MLYHRRRGLYNELVHSHSHAVCLILFSLHQCLGSRLIPLLNAILAGFLVHILLLLHDVLDLVIIDIDPELLLKLTLYRDQLRRAIPRPNYLLPI